ncbi:hypothetical protein N7509_008128 [Penicillium cosmopolitanum]|uniref:MARVEL domain-containing protein n=1 Tax=Penicillium cosmopolitanum TaxID=1131564 RepID=A0A9W9W092_9EURO|nr:uncharacterized protein N7509_008128 [Penicillium cosmopolitanum]KAJ5392638.1 hypothetical protein N7509_008128 [Penicillium cosmopolitanum]
MLALHTALYVLLGTALVFAIVELGLSAYVVSGYSGNAEEWSCDAFTCGYHTVKVSTPGILAFLVFVSLWTMIVSVAAAVLPWFYARKGNVTSKLNMTLGISTIVVYFITSVFWLACFADIVTIFGAGNVYNDYLNAVVAFAVLLWLIFVALVILTILTAVGVLVSSWPGHQNMRQNRTSGTAPVHDVPMSTAPPAPLPGAVPSELSARDAEALHDQAHSQSHSISSPSAVNSAELDGGNGHKY